MATPQASRASATDRLLVLEQALQMADLQLGPQIELFKAVASLAMVGHWVLDIESRHLAWSNGLYVLTGLVPGNVHGMEAARTGILTGDVDQFDAALRPSDGATVEYRCMHPDGNVRWLRSRMRRQRTAKGRTVDFGVVRDIAKAPTMRRSPAIIAPAHSMAMTVVAERVETAGQREFLLRHGGRVFQGILFGRPC